MCKSSISLKARAYRSPPGRMTFDVAGVRYVVLNDGSVSIISCEDNADKAARTPQAIPISFEVRHFATALLI